MRNRLHKFKILGKTYRNYDDIDDNVMLNVYECVECHQRVKAESEPNECYFCREAIRRWHEEEASQDII